MSTDSTYIAVITQCYHHMYTHRGIFPHAISFLRRAPIIGIVLNLPGISRVSKCIITRVHNIGREATYIMNP